MSQAQPSSDPIISDRLTLVYNLWQPLRTGNWSAAALNRLYLAVQQLAESCEQHEKLGDRILELEVYLSSFVDAEGVTPKTDQLAEVERLFGAVMELGKAFNPRLGQAQPTPTPTTANSQRRLLLLQAASEPVQGLAQALKERGYTVLLLRETETAITALQRQPPDAVLITMNLAEKQWARLGSIVTQLRQYQQVRLPVICIGPDQDVMLRLQTMRAGVDAYFNTGVESGVVIDRLGELLQAQAAAPYRILVVDDEPSHARFAQAILQKAGMETRAVTDPLKVPETLGQFKPDLILMDLYMPGCDGMELTAMIRERDEGVNVPIVFLSGEQDEDKQIDALNAGGDDFIAKPLRPRHLISAVTSRIRRARQLDARLRPLLFKEQAEQQAGRVLTRNVFYQQLLLWLGKPPKQVTQALLWVELEQVRKLIEQVGVPALDKALEAVGTRLASQLQADDLIGRFSDGGFTVLARRNRYKDLCDLAEQLRNTLASRLFELGEATLALTGKVGGCVLQGRPDQATRLLLDAQTATLQSKDGECSIRQAKEAGGQGELLDLLRDALQHDSLQAMYQPFVSLRGASGEHYQMFLRLPKPNGEVVPAAVFLQLAEEADLLLDIDRWMLLRALQELAAPTQRNRPLRVMVYQSAASLKDPLQINWLTEQLTQYPPELARGFVLCFEMKAVADNLRVAKQKINLLQAKGIRVALNNFNLEPETIQLLQYLPVAFLRIERESVRSKEQSLAGLVKLSHEQGKQIIIAKVEDARSLGELWGYGVDFIQGDFVQPLGEALDFDFSGFIF